MLNRNGIGLKRMNMKKNQVPEFEVVTN